MTLNNLFGSYTLKTSYTKKYEESQSLGKGIS